MVGVDSMTQSERIGQDGRAEERRPVMESDDRPNPRTEIHRQQEGIDPDDLSPDIRRSVVKDMPQEREHGLILR
jgi:hypothetical protein